MEAECVEHSGARLAYFNTIPRIKLLARFEIKKISPTSMIG